jgi:hypothetical protein
MKLLFRGIEKLENAPEDLLGIPVAAILVIARSLQSDLASGRVPDDPATLFRLGEPRRTA